MVYGTYNYIVNGVYKPTYNYGLWYLYPDANHGAGIFTNTIKNTKNGPVL